MSNGILANSSQAELMQAANRVVNQVFFGTLLREFRAANPMPMTGKGMAGSAFLQQLDQVLIERMTQGKDTPLARALVRQITGGRTRTDNGPAAQWEGGNRG